jgi:integrase
MPSITLTDRTVKNVKPPAKGRIEYWDAALPGFGLRVTDKGAKSWTMLYRAHGRQRRSTLGGYPALSLKEARDRARAVLRGDVDDPAAAKAEERRREADLFQTVAAEFIAKHARPNNRTWQRQDSDLKREFVGTKEKPLWRDRPIAGIAKRDILEVLDNIAERTSPRRGNRYLALIKRLFNWCAERGYVETSPAANIKPLAKEVSRDRVLSDDELRLVWQRCEAVGWPFGPLFQLLILTAQRLGEVATMRWCELDLDTATWSVPAASVKNGVANEVPLSAAAVAILSRLPTVGQDGFVFPALNGSTNPVSGFSRAKRRLDKAIAAALAKTARPPMPPWILHDLRRTAATGMAKLGIAPHVIEKVLNHVTGSLAGVAGIYNRFGYGPEKRHALETWAAHIEGLIDPPVARVVAIGGRR